MPGGRDDPFFGGPGGFGTGELESARIVVVEGGLAVEIGTRGDETVGIVGDVAGLQATVAAGTAIE